jgi:hypothetical protein
MDWFAMAWRAAQNYRATQLVRVDQLQQEAKSYPWRNLTYIARNGKPCTVRASSLRLVLEAILELATRYTTTEPVVSQQAVAAITKRDPKTIRKALGGLEVLGWIRCEKTGVYQADIYSLVDDPGFRDERLSSPSVQSGTFDLLLGPEVEQGATATRPLLAL